MICLKLRLQATEATALVAVPMALQGARLPEILLRDSSTLLYPTSAGNRSSETLTEASAASYRCTIVLL
jgi:hypothetical protein